MGFIAEEGGCGDTPAVQIHLDRRRDLWSPLALPPQTQVGSPWSAAVWDSVWIQVYIESKSKQIALESKVGMKINLLVLHVPGCLFFLKQKTKDDAV